MKKLAVALVAVSLALGSTALALVLTRSGPGPFASQQVPVWVCLPTKTATVSGQGDFVAPQPTTIDSVRLDHLKGMRLLGFKVTTDAIGSAEGWSPGPSHIQAHEFFLVFGLERTAKTGQSRDVEVIYTIGGTQYQWSDPVTFTMRGSC